MEGGRLHLGAPGGQFTQRQDVPTGIRPGEFAYDDFDGDAIPDVALGVNSGLATLTLLKGLGGGRFASSQPIGQFGTIFGVLSADLDNDGRRDLVFSDYSKSNVTLLMNGGAMPFSPPQTTNTHSSPTELAAADLNNDGLLDLAVGTAAGVDILLHLPGTPITFETRTLRTASGQPIHGVAIGDVTGDGQPDIIANDAHGDLSVFVATGNADFDKAVTLDAGFSSHSPVVGDLSADRLPDIALADQSGVLHVWFSQANGSPIPQPTLPIGGRPTCLRLADLDDDGLLDLVVADAGRFALRSFMNLTK